MRTHQVVPIADGGVAIRTIIPAATMFIKVGGESCIGRAFRCVPFTAYARLRLRLRLRSRLRVNTCST
jgi:hypothetical protein